MSKPKRYTSKKTNKISWENVVKSTHFLDSATFLSWHPWPARGPFPAALPASPRATPGPQRSRDPERLRTADLAVSEMTRELWQNNSWTCWSHVVGRIDVWNTTMWTFTNPCTDVDIGDTDFAMRVFSMKLGWPNGIQQHPEMRMSWIAHQKSWSRHFLTPTGRSDNR